MTVMSTAFSLATSSLSPSPAPAVQTRTVAADSYQVANSAYWQAWDRVLDAQFIPWANGHVEVDDDLLPPSLASLRTAIALAYKFRDAGLMPPTDVLPNGNGGVWLEHRNGQRSSQIEVLRDGSVEFSRFDEHGLIDAELVPACRFISG